MQCISCYLKKICKVYNTILEFDNQIDLQASSCRYYVDRPSTSLIPDEKEKPKKNYAEEALLNILGEDVKEEVSTKEQSFKEPSLCLCCGNKKESSDFEVCEKCLNLVCADCFYDVITSTGSNHICEKCFEESAL